MDDKEAEKILDKFISDEKWKLCGGSGDDAAYMIALENYVNEQKGFWIDAVKTFTQIGIDMRSAEVRRNMGERYWVSGVQIGMMLAYIKVGQYEHLVKILDQIQDKQFIGNKKDFDIITR